MKRKVIPVSRMCTSGKTSLDRLNELLLRDDLQ